MDSNETGSLVAFLDGLRETKDAHVPEAVWLAGEQAVSAWKDGFNRALLLTMENALGLGKR